MILAAAARLFAEGGSEKMTTAALARAAGISEPILYRHFSSKGALLRALIEDVLEVVQGRLHEAARTAPDAGAALDRLCSSYPALARRMDVESRVIARALAERPSGPVREALRRHYESYEELLAGFVRRAQKERRFRSDVPPRVVAWYFIHGAVGYQLTQGLEASGQRVPGFERHLARLLMEGPAV